MRYADRQARFVACQFFHVECARQFVPEHRQRNIQLHLAVRARLTPASNGQPQINAASHLVVFAAKTHFSEADVDAYLKSVSAIRGAPLGGSGASAWHAGRRDHWRVG